MNHHFVTKCQEGIMLDNYKCMSRYKQVIIQETDCETCKLNDYTKNCSKHNKLVDSEVIK